jgi:hypothetical protein
MNCSDSNHAAGGAVTQVRNNTDALMAIQLATVRITLAKLTAPGALRAMADGSAGFKANASGSNTTGGGNPSITVKLDDGTTDTVAVRGVEAAVLSGRTDKASEDLASVYGALSALCDLAVVVSDIFARWNPPRQLTTKDVRDTTKDLWCANPAHGHALAQRSGRSAYCSFCAGFRTANGVSPDEVLCDRNHQGKHLTTKDYEMWRIRQKAGKKGKGRREAA